MIKPNELRIGNYVLYDSGSLLNTIVGLMDVPSALISTSSGHRRNMEYERLNPIPLTEEWLEIFGFEKIDYSTDKMSVLPCYEKNIILEKIVDEWSLCDHSFENVQLISFVHQLQNLYFALTGEELTIKETAKA